MDVARDEQASPGVSVAESRIGVRCHFHSSRFGEILYSLSSGRKRFLLRKSITCSEFLEQDMKIFETLKLIFLEDLVKLFQK